MEREILEQLVRMTNLLAKLLDAVEETKVISRAQDLELRRITDLLERP